MHVRAWILAPVVLLLAAGCGGSKRDAFRIGILSDCYGPLGSLNEPIVAAAELPLLERGAALRGKQPSNGIASARVAGRPVELAIGCVAGNDDVLAEARRLVEEEGADALVGPINPEEGMILRQYAGRRPETAFLIQPSAAPEATLSHPAPNVFRFAPDSAESAAGAGTYAYRSLGWRNAVVVGDDAPFSWAQAAGFIAEFCALGGHIVDRSWITVGTDPAGAVGKLPRTADGVFLAPSVSPMLGFVKRYGALHPDLSRRLVSTAALLYDPTVLPRATGVAVAGPLPFEPTPSLGAFAGAFTKAFPTIPAAVAIGPITVGYRDGVEAVLKALEQTRGAAGKPLLRALAAVRVDSPSGRIRLDRDRQAIVPSYLTRVARGPQGKPTLRTVRIVPDVEQTFGGYFRPSDPPPSRASPACRKRQPPPWAS